MAIREASSKPNLGIHQIIILIRSKEKEQPWQRRKQRKRQKPSYSLKSVALGAIWECAHGVGLKSQLF